MQPNTAWFYIQHNNNKGRMLISSPFEKAYELLNRKAFKFSHQTKIHIFQYMCEIFCVEFHKCLWNSTQNIWHIHWKIRFLYITLFAHLSQTIWTERPRHIANSRFWHDIPITQNWYPFNFWFHITTFGKLIFGEWNVFFEIYPCLVLLSVSCASLRV